MNKIFFITGVNGVGKTSIMSFLSMLLPADKFEIHDFDERGVPEDADRGWRISETKHWIAEGNRLAEEGKSTIICGFIKPSDLEDYKLVNQGFPEIVLVLLFANPEIIRQRLTGRYTKNGIFDESQKVIGKPVSEFINDNVWFAEKMKSEFEEYNYPIIDTSDLSPAEVAEKVAEIIRKKIKNQ